jgi:urease accessory protein
VQRIFIAGQASRQSSTKILPNEKENMETDRMPVLRFNHFACIFGGAMRHLEVPRETAAQLFFFNHLRSIMAAAVRLNIIGPMEAQALQRQLTPVADEVLSRCESLTLEDIAQTSTLLDLWQGAQDRLYSRLFQS